ncbi:Rha family transcriptional regulator [Listeria valentina]|uniref:Rha family transcriptional regulator n=1 Tax=Listeria valentina TaxID=2705293 RepID=UPI001430351D|nr:Rha family transcriptional regulator [Listeria valentina]
MNDLVVLKDHQAVTSSLNVANIFGKQHKDVLKAIRNLKIDQRNFAQMFIESSEPDSYGRDRKVIYMNRDGFTFIAFGFTGAKADEFKLKYIEAFNEMEQYIKKQLDTSNLSPELQMFNQMFLAVANAEREAKEAKTEINDMKMIFSVNANEWRDKVKTILRKIANNFGGTEPFRSVINMSYERFESRAHCDLNRRLENRKIKMSAKGMSKTSIQKLNKLDCIAEEKRLIEIYLTVVKEMAIQFGIRSDDIDHLKVI